jgi:hypothetical protein
VEAYTYRVLDDATGIVLDADFEPPQKDDWRDVAPLAEGDLIHVTGVDRVVVDPVEQGVRGGILRVTTKERFAYIQIDAAFRRLAETGDEEEIDPARFHGLTVADLAAIADEVRRKEHLSAKIAWREGGTLVLEPMLHVE